MCQAVCCIYAKGEEMGRIMFFCIPAHGHTNPTLSVVRELINRGHEVVYYSYNNFKEKIENTGAMFVSCDEYDCEMKLSAKDGKRISTDLAFATKVLVDTTLALEKKIAEDIQNFKPDCIVADSMALWGRLSAKKYNIPFVSSTTTFAFNKESAKTMKQSFWQIIKMLFSMPKMTKEINRLKEKGFPINNILDIIANDENTDTVVYTSRDFQPCGDSFGEKYAFVGPSIRAKTTEFEKTYDKLVYISMGTVNNDMPSFYQNCIHAFKSTGIQVVMSVGESVNLDDFTNLPENIQVYNSVDQIAVLQKADAFITHCGMNSVSEALYFGVPLVMYPMTTEQGAVASRVEQMGAGIKLTKTDKDTISKTVSLVLESDECKKTASDISKGFVACSGEKGAADKIQEIIDNSQKKLD